jgi:hypothetical protein
MSRSAHRLPLIAVVAGIVACAEGPSEPPVAGPLLGIAPGRGGGPRVCHVTGSGARMIEIPELALAGHLAHGDYVTALRVDPGSPTIGDGVHFARVTDAVRAVRAVRLAHGEVERAACRITIAVAAGVFRGGFDDTEDPSLESFPLILDVPDVTLHGGLAMQLDERGRATGVAGSEPAVTTLAPVTPLRDVPAFEAMILVIGHPSGSRGDGVVIEGLAFESGHTGTSSGGIGILSLRVTGLVVRSNRFEPRLTSGMDLRATSARVEENYARQLGVSCAICLAGPGTYHVTANRILDGGLGGLYVAPSVVGLGFSPGADPDVPVEPYVAPPFADVTATIANNDVRGHVRKPIGFSLRVLSVGPGTPDVPQSAHVVVRDNDFIGNTFALVFDAGFPVANTLLQGNLEVALRGNVLTPSCQHDVLVAFTRHTGALGITVNPYLRHSSILMDTGGDFEWGDAWFSHPADLGNTLVVDGAEIPHGAQVAYDAARSCGS